MERWDLVLPYWALVFFWCSVYIVCPHSSILYWKYIICAIISWKYIYHIIFISQGTTIKILPWLSEKSFDFIFIKHVQTLMTMETFKVGQNGIFQYDITKHLWGSRVDCRDLNEKYLYSLKYLNICSLFGDFVWGTEECYCSLWEFVNLSYFLFSLCFIFMVEDFIPHPLSTCFHASQSSISLSLEP